MNLKKMYLYVNSTPQRCPNKIIKTFLIFSICYRCQRHRWCTLIELRKSQRFSKKIEMARMGYSGAWGKVIHGNNIYDFYGMISICLMLLSAYSECSEWFKAHTQDALIDFKRLLSMRSVILGAWSTCVFKKQNHKYQGQKLKKLYYFLVSKLSSHTGLDCIKNRETNISCLFPF